VNTARGLAGLLLFLLGIFVAVGGAFLTYAVLAIQTHNLSDVVSSIYGAAPRYRIRSHHCAAHSLAMGGAGLEESDICGQGYKGGHAEVPEVFVSKCDPGSTWTNRGRRRALGDEHAYGSRRRRSR
jgi:hypothetical protein